mgnify:CR=1 FL=1
MPSCAKSTDWPRRPRRLPRRLVGNPQSERRKVVMRWIAGNPFRMSSRSARPFGSALAVVQTTTKECKSRATGMARVCRWTPRPYHTAVGLSILCGGVAATIMDCHSMWTAMATVWQREGLSVTDSGLPMYLTRSLKIDYMRPTPLNEELTLRARVIKIGERSVTVSCSLYAGEVECARSETVAVRSTNSKIAG